MNHLYLSVFTCNNLQLDLPIESLIIYFIYKYSQTTTFNLNFVIENKHHNEPSFSIRINEKIDYNVIDKDDLPILATYCSLPIAIVKNITVISGLCSVARQIVKSSPNDEIRKLLGFREACLMACNESSIWTKFCEIDMIQTVKDTVINYDKHFDEFKIPKNLSRFECHMKQPVRIHNVYKVAQDQAKGQNKNISDINPRVPKEELNLSHLYGEGPYMTLADIILYPIVHLLYKILNEIIFINYLPLTLEWYKNMNDNIQIFDIELPIKLLKFNTKNIEQENVENQSLYISDPKRYKPKNRIFTKQADIINALNIIKDLNLSSENKEPPLGHNVEFDWSKIPLDANPEGGSLPKSRMKRKCEQLENLAKAIIRIASPKQTIVDFCSGSGHLGILLAVTLPACHVILLENKEISLNRAKDRVEKLQLNNITLLQCNLDYFVGNFEIGVSLHACGVATDLVIAHCLRRNASFVSCPCCYGGVHVTHHISYPRSQIFQQSSLTLRDYLVLGHSADQTHDSENAKTNQGIECMNIIDTDRKLQAEEFGYVVTLSKMIPESCTPKNNILIGLSKRDK